MPDLFFERKARREGARVICGVDEAGRGPLAGPVVAAACVLPAEKRIKGVEDSKKLTKKKREDLYHEISFSAYEIGIGYALPERIDLVNILNASLEAMRNAVASLSVFPDYLLVDGIYEIPIPGITQLTIVRGDSKSYTIAAASIVAKVIRDRMMELYDLLYPGYGFCLNAGYLTKKHLEAVIRFGPSPIHRKSFKPLKKEKNASKNRKGENGSIWRKHRR